MVRCLLCIVLVAITIFAGSTPAQASNAACASSDTLKAGPSIQRIQSGGIERRYLRYVPAGFEADKHTPLVISLHGFASNAVQQAYFSRWNEVADEYGFLVVYPQGTGTPARWNSGRNRSADDNNADDIQFMRDLLGSLTKGLCIDPSRIYVNGLSNGGGMTNRIACELTDQVAAVAMVAGAYTDFPGGCHPSRPIPVMAFHGTADPVVNFYGNARLGFPRITAWAAEWSARNGCTTRLDIPSQGEVSGLRYTDCKGNADVVFYEVEGGGHTWPGGNPIPAIIAGKTTKDINASETMWAFFEQHPLV